ncbi:hypothetical protein [Cryobacterium lyxosi]|nr:hypothetical protein [Cryobacterium lyxosi]
MCDKKSCSPSDRSIESIQIEIEIDGAELYGRDEEALAVYPAGD